MAKKVDYSNPELDILSKISPAPVNIGSGQSNVESTISPDTFDKSKYANINPDFYSKDINYNNLSESFQGGVDKFFNTIAQGSETLVDAVINGAAALGSLAYAGIVTPFNDNSFMENWLRNDVMTTLSDLDKQFKEELVPVRQKSEDLENAWSGWNVVTGISNGIGFLASGLIGTGVIGQGVNALTKTARLAEIADIVLGDTAKTLSKAQKVAKLTEKLGTTELKQIVGKLNQLEEAGQIAKGGTQKFLEYQHKLDKAGELVGSLYSRIGESQMEAMQTFETIKSKYDEDIKNGNISEEEVDKIAQSESNKVFWGNMPLMFMDYLEFQTIVKGAKRLGFKSSGTGVADIEVGADGVAKSVTRSTLGNLGRNTLRVGQSAFLEGTEEGLQYGLQKAAEDLADNKILRVKNGETGETNNEYIDFFKKFLNHTKEGLNEPEGQLSIFLGALLGGAGAAFSNLKNKPNNQYLQQSKNLADTYNKYREINGVPPINENDIVVKDGVTRLTKDAAAKLNNYQILSFAIDQAEKKGDTEAVKTLQGLQNAYHTINQVIKGDFNEYIKNLKSERDNSKDSENVDESVAIDDKINQAIKFKEIFDNIHNSEAFANISFDLKQKLVYRNIAAELINDGINDLAKEFNSLTSKAIQDANNNGASFSGNPEEVSPTYRQRYKELKNKLESLKSEREKILNEYDKFESNPTWEDFKETSNKVGNALSTDKDTINTKFVNDFLTNPDNQEQIFSEDINHEEYDSEYIKTLNDGKIYKYDEEKGNYKEITGDAFLTKSAVDNLLKENKAEQLSKTVTKGVKNYKVSNGKLLDSAGNTIAPTKELISRLKKRDDNSEKDNDRLFELESGKRGFVNEQALEHNKRVVEEKLKETIEQLDNNSTLSDGINENIKNISNYILILKEKVNKIKERIKSTEESLLNLKDKKGAENRINKNKEIILQLLDEIAQQNELIEDLKSEQSRLNNLNRVLEDKINIYKKLLKQGNSTSSLLSKTSIVERINKYEKSLSRINNVKKSFENTINEIKTFINDLLNNLYNLVELVNIPTAPLKEITKENILKTENKLREADSDLFENEVVDAKLGNLIDYTTNAINALYELLDNNGIKDYDLNYFLEFRSKDNFIKAIKLATELGIVFTKQDQEILKTHLSTLNNIKGYEVTQTRVIPDIEFDSFTSEVIYNSIDDKAEQEWDGIYLPAMKSFEQLSSSTTSRQFEDYEDTQKSKLKHNHILNKFLEFLDIYTLKSIYYNRKNISGMKISDISDDEVIRLKGVSYHKNPEYFTVDEVLAATSNKYSLQEITDKKIPVFKFIVQINNGENWYDASVKALSEVSATRDKSDTVSTYLHNENYDEFYDTSKFKNKLQGESKTQEQIYRENHKKALDFINSKLNNGEEVILNIESISSGIPVEPNEPLLLTEVFDESNSGDKFDINNGNKLRLFIFTDKKQNKFNNHYNLLSGIVTAIWKGKRLPLITRNINDKEVDTLIKAFYGLLTGNEVVVKQGQYKLKNDLKYSDIINQFLYLSKRDGKKYYDKETKTLYLTDYEKNTLKEFNLSEIFNNKNEEKINELKRVLKQQIRQVNASLLNINDKDKNFFLFYLNDELKHEVIEFKNYNESLITGKGNAEPVLKINMVKPEKVGDVSTNPLDYKVSLKSLYLNISNIVTYYNNNKDSKPNTTVNNDTSNTTSTNNKSNTTTKSSNNQSTSSSSSSQSDVKFNLIPKTQIEKFLESVKLELNANLDTLNSDENIDKFIEILLGGGATSKVEKYKWRTTLLDRLNNPIDLGGEDEEEVKEQFKEDLKTALSILDSFEDEEPSQTSKGNEKKEIEDNADKNIEFDEKGEEEEKPENNTEITNTGNTEFDKLPSKSTTPTMTYAGIGSRQTPPEVLAQITEVAKELSNRFTLNTGISFNGKEEGADAAFSKGTENKNLFSPEKQGSRQKEQAIAKEIHPNPNALSSGGLKLMARNTNQIFGDNLNTPVDFVLFYAKETNGIRPEGGTGQAVEMARLKGIPTINMANPNWRQELDLVLQKINNKNNDDDTPAFRTLTTAYDKIENFEQFKEWFYARFPKSINVEKVYKLIQGKAMGSFRDKVISLWENAEEGTGFHEAFHAAFRLFLSKSERNKLLKEFREKEGYGKTFRGITKKYSEFSDLEIEESLAEEFRKTILENPNVPTMKWNILNKFYNFIKDMFKHIFYNKTYKDMFFEKIQKGYYTNAKVAEHYIGETAFKLDGKTNDFTNKVLDSINVVFFDILRNNIDLATLEIKLFNEDGKTLNEELRGIYNLVYDAHVKLANELKDNQDIDNQYLSYISDRTNFIEQIVPQHIERLKQLKITADINTYKKQLDISDEEYDIDEILAVDEEQNNESVDETSDEGDNKKETFESVGERQADFEKSKLAVNPKQTLSKKIKFLLAFNKKVVKLEDGTFTNVYNPKTGLYERFNSDETYKKLINELLGIYDFVSMQQRLSRLIKDDTKGKHLDIFTFCLNAGILDDNANPVPLQNVSEKQDKYVDLNLAAQFRTAFLKTKNNAYGTKEYANGTSLIIDYTLKGFKDKQLNDFRANNANFNYKYINTALIPSVKNNTKLRKGIVTIFDNREGKIGIFDRFGITLNKKGEYTLKNVSQDTDRPDNIYDLFFTLTGIVLDDFKIVKAKNERTGATNYMVKKLSNTKVPEDIKNDVLAVLDQIVRAYDDARRENIKLYLTYDNLLEGLSRNATGEKLTDILGRDYSYVTRLNNIYKYNYEKNKSSVFSYLTADRKTNYAIGLPTFYTMVSDSYNAVFSDLPEHLSLGNNEYVKHSLLLKRRLDWLNEEEHYEDAPEIHVSYNNGDTAYYEDSGLPNNKMGEANRVKQFLNFVLDGKYTNFKESDKTLNAVFDFGEFVKMDDIMESNYYKDFYYKVFKYYLLDEINFNKSVGYNENVSIPLLDTVLSNLKKTIFKDKNLSEISEIISSDLKSELIIKEVESYFNGVKNNLIKYLINNNIIIQNSDVVDEFTVFLNNSRINELMDKKVNYNAMSKYNVDNLIKYALINSFIGRQEILKLFVGSPSQFKNFEEMIKRMGSTAAAKVFPDVSESFITSLNDIYGGVDNYVYTDRIKVKVVPEIKESTFKNETAIENIKAILKLKYKNNKNADELVQKELDAYQGKDGSNLPEHSDGFGRINPYKYKQFMISIGRWGNNKEKAFQDIMNNPTSKEVINKYPNMFPIEKLQYFGIDDKGRSVILKFSVMPAFRQYFNDTNIYEQTKDDDLIVYPTAVKGFKLAENESHILPFEYLGLQVENPQKDGNDVKINLITQFEKSVYQALYSEGEVTIPELKDKLSEITKLKAAIVFNNDKEGLKKIGIDNEGNVVDNRLLIEYLVDSATASNLSENTKIAINKLIDKLESKEEVRPLNLLMDSDRLYPVIQSIFGKVIKYKKRGMQLVQFPASALGYDLKFYEDGSMEVLVPEIYKGNNKAINQFLETVAARIPVEGLTSIEKLKVVGFTPKNLGNAIGLPNGIVIKSGTDYDFDKLNVYFPYFDNKGNPLEYYDNPNEEQLETLFNEYFNKNLKLDKDYKELLRNYKKALEVETEKYKRLIGELKNQNKEYFTKKSELKQDLKELYVTKEEYREAKAKLTVLKSELKNLKTNENLILSDNEEEALTNSTQSKIEGIKKEIDYYQTIVNSAVESKRIKTEEFDKIDKEFESFLNQLDDYNDKIKEIKETLSKDIEELKSDLKPILREEFDSLPIEVKNGNKRLENKILLNYLDILSNPEVQSYMLAPSNTDDAKAMANLFKEEVTSKNKFEGVVNPLLNEKQAVANNVAKDQVSTGALHISNQNLTQIADITSTAAIPNFESLKSTDNSLSKATDVNGVSMAFRLRDFTSGFVDAAKDTWVFRLNLVPYVTDVAITLTRLGLNRGSLFAFTTHPAIKAITELNESAENGLLRRFDEETKSITGAKFVDAVLPEIIIPLLKKAGVSEKDIDKHFYNEKGGTKYLKYYSSETKLANAVVKVLNELKINKTFPNVSDDLEKFKNHPIVKYNLKFKNFNL